MNYEESISCFSNEFVTVRGKLERKEFKNEKYRLYLSTDCGGVLVFSEKEYPIGSILEAAGEPMELKGAENEGGFDYQGYLKGQGVYAAMYDPTVRLLGEAINPVPEFFYRLRRGIALFFEDNLPGEESGLLSAMVIGEKSGLDEEVRDMFQVAGLSHILAISGLHLSVVGMGLYKLFRRFGLSFVKSGVIAGAAVVAYGLLSGNPVSMIRAVGMFICMVTAAITGRGYDMLNALSLMAMLLIFQNPFIIQNSGFILSFMAIIGIICVAKPLTDYYSDCCKRRWESIYRVNTGKRFKMKRSERIVMAIIGGLGIQMFSYPLILMNFYAIPVYVIFLNLIILPVMGVLLFLGLFSGLLMIAFPLTVCHFILFYYEAAADFASKLPGASLILGCPQLPLVAAYYAGLYVLVKVVTSGRLPVCKGVGSGRLLSRRLKFVRDNNPRGFAGYVAIGRQIYTMIGVTLAGLCLLLWMLSIRGDRGFGIDMLSVGQGDGIYIQSEDGVSFFVDGGSTSQKNVGKYVILPFLKYRGVGKIDYWLLTHLDEDHYNGFLEVLESGYGIDNLVVPYVMKNMDGFQEIKELCQENKTRINFVARGDAIKTKNSEIKFVYPEKNSKNEGTNENSLSFIFSYGGFDAIFTGDLGSEGESDILNDDLFIEKIAKNKIEILKAGHHGSNNSNSDKWLDAIDPECFIISAGKNNRYGHPGKETMERIRERKIKSLCTIDNGQIHITCKGDRLLLP